MSGILDGWLKVPIEQICGLDQARAMQARIESRQLSGKLLLRRCCRSGASHSSRSSSVYGTPLCGFD
jgi:hypothetical protein